MSNSLPRPTPAFDGEVQRLITDSTPSRPAVEGAPAGAPNVLLIMLDDVGFGSFDNWSATKVPETKVPETMLIAKVLY